MKLHLIKHPDPNKRISLTVLDRVLIKPVTPFESLIESDFDLMGGLNMGFHIVSPGVIGLTNLSFVCEFGYGINQIAQEMTVLRVNEAKETGTLWPKHNLTILPYRYKTSALATTTSLDYTNGKGFMPQEVEVHLNDAIKAEIEYVKAKRVLFDFRDLREDMFRYNNILLRLLSERYNNVEADIYLFSYDNSEWTKLA